MAENYSEILFQSIDTIIEQRLKNLPYDRTIIATIIDDSKAISNNIYKVTTDNFTTFYAYSEDFSYSVDDKVYIRIPAGDYTQQKVIVGKYIAEQNNLTFGNINHGFFYAGYELNNNISSNESNNEIKEWNFNLNDSFTKQGYSGFDLFFTLEMPIESEQNTVQEKIKTLEIEINNNYKINGSDLITNYSNLFDGNKYSSHINFPIDIGITSITVKATGNENDNINKITCSCTLGYLLQERLSNGDFYLLIYDTNDSSEYYQYQGVETTRNLSIRLLSIQQLNNNDLIWANKIDFINSQSGYLFLGIANDNLTLVQNTNLQGRYYVFTNELETDDNGQLKTIYNYFNNLSTDFFNCSCENGELQVNSLKLISTSRTTSIRAYYDEGTDLQEDALSNIYTFYAQSNTAISGVEISLTAERDTFYTYGLSNKIIPPGLAFKDYILTLEYNNKNDENDTLEDASIEDEIPKENTMFQFVEHLGFEQNNYKKYNFKFRIKDYYTPAANNNTITIKITKNGQTYQVRKEFLFGSNSSQGDEYILNMWLADENGNLLPGLHKGDTGFINWELYNYQNVLITSNTTLGLTHEFHRNNPDAGDGDRETNATIYQIILSKDNTGEWAASVACDEGTKIESTDNGIVQGFLPIPFLSKSIIYANAPTTIIYNITGKMPDYYKDVMAIFQKDEEYDNIIELDSVEWVIMDNQNNELNISDSTVDNNAPVINNNQLYARTIYNSGDMARYRLCCKQNNETIYTCPLYIGQNKYYKPMIIQESNNTEQEINNESGIEIENVAIGRVEKDGSKLYIGVLKTQNQFEENPLGLYAYKNDNNQLFELTGNTLVIGGKPIESITYEEQIIPYWNGGKVSFSETASKLNITNVGNISTPIYFSNGIPVVSNANIGRNGQSAVPIYMENGELKPITKPFPSELLGFNENDNNFQVQSKLYYWLKVIQSNINKLAAKHNDITLTDWPADLQ